MIRLLAAAALASTGLLPAYPATADTPGCVSRGEYDNMERLLSVDQVRGRFDTNGVYIASSEERFRRGYDACWTNARRVVVIYSLNTGLSVDWDVRDY